MAYLKQHNVIHRYLAATNILVGEDLTCKVAIYEMARVMDKDMSMNSKLKKEANYLLNGRHQKLFCTTCLPLYQMFGHLGFFNHHLWSLPLSWYTQCSSV